jgi:NADPH:quinone reductase-like Zn-dependent oxidoreductase
MRAVVQDRYGPPEVLELREVEEPRAGDGQVLVAVRAASVNPADWYAMTGTPWVARAQTGPRRPRSGRLGLDLAGEVTAVCSTRNVEAARSLGADRVVDYTREDFTATAPGHDLLLDVAGSRP